MKRIILFSIIALTILATPALADLKIEVTAGPRSGSGGAFWAEIVEGSISYSGVYLPTGSTFLTFCVENNEYISLGQEYWVTIQDYATKGGSGGGSGSPSTDPLSPVTAALYEQYLGLGDMSTSTADKYQLAIWQQEAEAQWVVDSSQSDGGDWYKGDGVTPLNNAYQSITPAIISSIISSVGSPTDIGLVKVMTLWEDQDRTIYKQDLLVVPVPAAVLLGILGLSVAGIKLRKYA